MWIPYFHYMCGQSPAFVNVAAPEVSLDGMRIGWLDSSFSRELFYVSCQMPRGEFPLLISYLCNFLVKPSVSVSISSQLSCAASSRAVSPLVVPGDFSQPASPFGCLDNSAAKHKLGLRYKACNKRKPIGVRCIQTH